MVNRTVPGKEQRSPRRPEQNITLGADAQYQDRVFIEALREREVAPHVAEYVAGNLGKNALSDAERSDERRGISQRKRIERVFGWTKLDRGLRQVKLRGLDRVDWFYRLAISAYNLMRMRRLIPIRQRAKQELQSGRETCWFGGKIATADLIRVELWSFSAACVAAGSASRLAVVAISIAVATPYGPMRCFLFGLCIANT